MHLNISLSQRIVRFVGRRLSITVALTTQYSNHKGLRGTITVPVTREGDKPHVLVVSSVHLPYKTGTQYCALAA